MQYFEYLKETDIDRKANRVAHAAAKLQAQQLNVAMIGVLNRIENASMAIYFSCSFFTFCFHSYHHTHHYIINCFTTVHDAGNSSSLEAGTQSIRK